MALPLNLVVAKVCGRVRRVDKSFVTLQGHYNFFSKIIVHGVYERIVAELQPTLHEVRRQSLSETRWYTRHTESRICYWFYECI